MPFMLTRSEQGYCVYTQGDDGGPTGEPHGCHPTRDQAVAQLRALYANVPEARKGTPTEKEGAPKSPPKGYPEERSAYGDPKNYRYPLDTEAHVRAAWSYINMPKNQGDYSPGELATIKARIKAAGKKYGIEFSDAEKSMGDFYIHLGAAVKAMGDGKVGGYLVQFGSEVTKDADGEWFTPETDFDTDFPARASIYYNHGLDPTVGRRRLGHGTMKADDLGVWVEAQLDLHDRYQAAMYQMATAGKLGWSSGSLSHLTTPPRDTPGGPITAWALGHDASLTPMPADRRNMAIALKSWDPPSLLDLAGGTEELPCSLAESTERLLDRYQEIATKSGMRLSAPRWQRLKELYEGIGAVLSETDPQRARVSTTTDPPDTETGEGDPAPGAPEGRSAAALPLPDPDAVYHLLSRAADHQAPWVPV